MGNGRERISGQLNEADAPVAGGVWNDAGEEPDIAMQDSEDIREVTADAADSGKRADVFFAEVLENTRSHVQILLNEGRVCKGQYILYSLKKILSRFLHNTDICAYQLNRIFY